MSTSNRKNIVLLLLHFLVSCCCATDPVTCDYATVRALTCKALIQTASGKEVTGDYCKYVRGYVTYFDGDGTGTEVKYNKAGAVQLDLSGKGIKGFHVCAFYGFNDLQELALQDNQIVTLDHRLFAGLSKLELLWLGNNQLETLADGLLAGLSDLKALDLSNNQLETLADGVFDGLSKLLELYLGGNPELTCTPRKPSTATLYGGRPSTTCKAVADEKAAAEKVAADEKADTIPTAEKNDSTIIGVAIGAVVCSLFFLAAVLVVWRIYKGKRIGASGAQAPSNTPSIAMSTTSTAQVGRSPVGREDSWTAAKAQGMVPGAASQATMLSAPPLMPLNSDAGPGAVQFHACRIAGMPTGSAVCLKS